MIGVIGATYPVFQFIGAPLLGRLSDRYGRRPILLVSQIGTLIGFLVLMLFDSFLFAGRVMIAKEPHTSLSVKDLIVAAHSIEDAQREGTYTKGWAEF